MIIFYLVQLGPALKRPAIGVIRQAGIVRQSGQVVGADVFILHCIYCAKYLWTCDVFVLMVDESGEHILYKTFVTTCSRMRSVCPANSRKSSLIYSIGFICMVLLN